MFKGIGSINTEADQYKFMIWAGAKDHPETDTFTIKIWQEDDVGTETVLYENGKIRRLVDKSRFVMENVVIFVTPINISEHETDLRCM